MIPIEYVEYLIHFHTERDYFECHEVLEEYWKETNMKDKVWVGLIQVAVSLYHHRRGNYKGALKMMQSATKTLELEKEAVIKLGIKYDEFMSVLSDKLKDIKELRLYSSVNIPLEDVVLQKCLLICTEKRLHWGAGSKLENEEIIHKHTLRDRSDVIRDRYEQIKMRQGGK
jgi:predicted metal-dependent hydrolase